MGVTTLDGENMNTVSAWAKRHGVSQTALTELQRIMTEPTVPGETGQVTAGSETAVSQAIRLEASRNGVRLWRNNVGAAVTDTGRHIRYGLANESRRMNTVVKSSDFIGVTPVLVTHEHVGTTLGVFTSIEAKHGRWKYTGTPREQAQLKWLNIIQALGGIARFQSGVIDTAVNK